MAKEDLRPRLTFYIVEDDTPVPDDENALADGKDGLQDGDSGGAAQDATARPKTTFRKDEDMPQKSGTENAGEPRKATATAQTTPAANLPAPLAPDESPDLALSPEAEEKFQKLIDKMTAAPTIENDEHKHIEWCGEMKRDFIDDLERGFAFFKRLLNVNFYQAGRFFSDVKKRQAPKKLWLAYLRTIGFPKRTATKYIKVYRSIGEDLGKYAYLGSTKLEIVARLKAKEVRPYLEAHSLEIEQKTLKEVIDAVNQELKRKPPDTGAKEGELKLGSVRLKGARNKKSITITGLNKERYDLIMDALKEALKDKT